MDRTLLYSRLPPIKFEAEAEFYRCGSVGFDIGFGGVVIEMVQVVDHKANESLTVFVFSRFGSDIHIPIRFTWKAFPDDFMNRNFMFDSIGAEDVVVVEGGVVFVPEAEVDEFDFAPGGPKGGGLVQHDRSASRPNIGEEISGSSEKPR